MSVTFTYTNSIDGIFDEGVGSFSMLNKEFVCKFKYDDTTYPYIRIEIELHLPGGEVIQLRKFVIQLKYLRTKHIAEALEEWTRRLRQAMLLHMPIDFYQINEHLMGFFPLTASRLRTNKDVVIFDIGYGKYKIITSDSAYSRHKADMFIVDELSTTSDTIYPYDYDLEGMVFDQIVYDTDNSTAYVSFYDDGAKLTQNIHGNRLASTITEFFIRRKHTLNELEDEYVYFKGLLRKGHEISLNNGKFLFINNTKEVKNVNKYVKHFKWNDVFSAVEVVYHDDIVTNKNVKLRRYIPSSVDPIECINMMLSVVVISDEEIEAICKDLSIEYDQGTLKVGDTNIKLMGYSDSEILLEFTYSKDGQVYKAVYKHICQGSSLSSDMKECLTRITMLSRE